jgi:hypothetical protein
VKGHAPGGSLRLRDRERDAVWIGTLLGAAVLLVVTIPRLDRNALWLDEAFTLGAAHQFLGTIRHTGATMALYYLFLVPWVKVSAATWWLRLPSLLFALATLPFAAEMGRRLGGRRLAVITPPLLALVYLFGVKAAEARAYSLETLFVAVGWYAVMRIFDVGVDDPAARRWWWLLAGLAFLGPMTHGLFPLFVLAWLVALVLSPTPRRALWHAVPIVVATLVVLGILDLLGATEVGDWVDPTTQRQVVLLLHHLTSTNRVISTVLLLLVVVAWGLATAAYLRSRRSDDAALRLRSWQGVLPAVGVLVPCVSLAVVSVVRPSFLDRYVAPATPMMAVALGCGVLAAADGAARLLRRTGHPAFVAMAVGCVLVLLAASQPAVDHGTYEDWHGATRLVAAQARPGDGLILYSSLDRPPFEAAWGEMAKRPDVPVINTFRPKLGQVQRWDTYLGTADVQKQLAGHDRVWVVERWFEPGFGRYMLFSGLQGQYRLAGRTRFSVPDWGMDVSLYVRRGSPADSSP